MFPGGQYGPTCVCAKANDERSRPDEPTSAALPHFSRSRRLISRRCVEAIAALLRFHVRRTSVHARKKRPGRVSGPLRAPGLSGTDFSVRTRDSAGIGPDEVVHGLTAAAFDFDALARTQRVLLDLLEQPAAPAAAHLDPLNVRRVIRRGRTYRHQHSNLQVRHHPELLERSGTALMSPQPTALSSRINSNERQRSSPALTTPAAAPGRPSVGTMRSIEKPMSTPHFAGRLAVGCVAFVVVLV